MSIKFSCPHCNKTLKVRDELAGKRGKCPNPACQKIIHIPVHTITTPSRSGSSVLDLESLAAETLAEKRPEPAGVATTVDYTCPWCDENVKFTADLAGKQAPCPACKHIVKVPLLAKTGPRDWRKPDDDRLPSGAKRADATPEGAWGSETAQGVSRQALVEAAVIKEETEPLTARQWIIGGSAVAIAVGGLVIGLVWYLRYSKGKVESNAITAAQDYVKAGTGSPALQAELHRMLGIYHEKTKSDAKDTTGLQQFQHARLALARIADPNEKLGVVRELLRTLAELDQSAEELTQVLAQSPAGQVREDLVREMCRRSLAGASADAVPARAEKLRQAITSGVEIVRHETTGPASKQSAPTQDATEQNSCLAVLGQELARAGRSDLALNIAEPLRGQIAQFKPTQPFPIQLQALLIMLQKGDLEAGKGHEQELLAGRAAGFALAGIVARADETVKTEQFNASPLRATTLVTVAEVLIEKDLRPRAIELLKEALRIIELFPEDTAWQRQRVAELYAAAGDFDEAERLAASGHERTRLAVLALRLSQSGTADADLSGYSAQGAAKGVAAFLLGRAKGRTQGKAAFDWVESLDESLRPFGGVGAAVGMREGS